MWPIPAGAPSQRLHLTTPEGLGPYNPFQQGSSRLCAPFGLALALHHLGFADDAAKLKSIAENVSRSGDPFQALFERINFNVKSKEFKLWVCKSVSGAGTYTLDQMISSETPFTFLLPRVYQLLDSAGNVEHCISVANGWIFDSTEEYALPLTLDNLHRCCTPNECMGMFRAFVLSPSYGNEDKVK